MTCNHGVSQKGCVIKTVVGFGLGVIWWKVQGSEGVH